MRKDKYAIGDEVTFFPPDEYGFHQVAWDHEKKHGPGPYIVQEIEDVSTKAVSHSQWITINGETYSGYWFQPK